MHCGSSNSEHWPRAINCGTLNWRFPWVCTNCNFNGYCDDCGGTTKNHSRQNNIIADISMLRTLSMLEGDKSAMFFGVEEVCLPFYDRNKAK